MAAALAAVLCAGPTIADDAPAQTAPPHEVPAVTPPPASTNTTVPTWRRNIFLQRFRFRRIREFGQGEAEATISAATKPSGTSVDETQITQLPRNKKWETIKRSKREKRCNNTNDQTCPNDLSNNPDCRWTIHNRASDLIYTDIGLDYGSFIDFPCDPVEVSLEWDELDPNPGSVIITIAENLLHFVACLGKIFDNPGADVVERVWDYTLCNIQATSTLIQTHNQIANIAFDKKQDLGHLLTGNGTTPHVSVPTPLAEGCFWETPSENAGDIDGTYNGKTAQVELRQAFEPLGFTTFSGLGGCACESVAVPQSDADLRWLQVTQVAACELQVQVLLHNKNLRVLSAPNRYIRVFFETDMNMSTGDPTPPYCGADYYVDFHFVPITGGSDPGVNVYRDVRRWDNSVGYWVPESATAAYSVQLRECGVDFTVNLLQIGAPTPGMSVKIWAITMDITGFMYIPTSVLDIMPAGGGCIDPLVIPLVSEAVCPTVVDVNADALEFGDKSASIQVKFSEVVMTPTLSQVTITPSVPITLTMAANGRFLGIKGSPEIPAGHYHVELDGSIADCVGNGLANHTGVCGTGVEFDICVPEVNLKVSDASGTAKTMFDRGEEVYISGTNLPTLPHEITVYLSPADILGSGPRFIIDQSEGGLFSGPDTFNPTSTTEIQHYSLGSSETPGEYTIVIDMNQDGIYEENIDLTLNPCLPSILIGCPQPALAVDETCEPCDDIVAARIAYWPLDESYANSGAKDYEAGQDGTYVNSPTWVNGGAKGDALSFSGSNYVTVQPTELLSVQANEEFSVSGWINPSVNTLTRVILDHMGSGPGWRVALVNGKLSMRLKHGSNVADYPSSATIPINTWTHFVIAVDRSVANGLKIYLNGNQDSVHNANGQNGVLEPGTQPLWIGGDQSGGGAHFVGMIDEVGVWDEPLLLWHAALLRHADIFNLPCPGAGGAPLDAGDQPLAGAASIPGARMLTGIGSPFRETLRFSVQMPERGPVRVTLYDAAGRKVDTLVDEVLESGKRELSWDARSRASTPASGVYFLRLDALGKSETEKVVLVH